MVVVPVNRIFRHPVYHPPRICSHIACFCACSVPDRNPFIKADPLLFEDARLAIRRNTYADAFSVAVPRRTIQQRLPYLTQERF